MNEHFPCFNSLHNTLLSAKTLSCLNGLLISFDVCCQTFYVSPMQTISKNHYKHCRFWCNWLRQLKETHWLQKKIRSTYEWSKRFNRMSKFTSQAFWNGLSVFITRLYKAFRTNWFVCDFNINRAFCPKTHCVYYFDLEKTRTAYRAPLLKTHIVQS